MKSAKLVKLEKAFDESIARLSERIEAFPWEDREVYKTWLGQTYYLVRHTTRLICLSAGRCKLEDQELHKKSIWHLKEEWNHDEIAITDLKALGARIEDIPELSQSTVIYQANYYYIDHFGPYAIIGYSMMLEGLAAKMGHLAAERVGKAHGPRSAKFLKVHAEEDAEHVKAGLAFLEKLPEHVLDCIHDNLTQGCANYCAMLDAVLAAVEHTQKDQRTTKRVA